MEVATRTEGQPFDPQSKLIVNGSLVGAVGYQQFVLWDVVTGRIRKRLPAELGEIAVIWAWRGDRIAYHDPLEKRVQVISTDGSSIATLLADGPSPSQLAISPDGNQVAAALYPGGVRTFSPTDASNRVVEVAGPSPNAKVDLSYTANGELLIGSGSDQVPAQLWSADGITLTWSGESTRDYYHARKAGEKFVTITASAPEKFAIEVRDASFKGIAEFALPALPKGLAVNVDGSFAAIPVTGALETTRLAHLMDLASGKLRLLEGNAGGITDVAFAADGATLLTLSPTEGVLAFDVVSGALKSRFELPA